MSLEITENFNKYNIHLNVMLKTLIRQITNFTTQPGFRQSYTTTSDKLSSEVERIQALYDLIGMDIKPLPNSQFIKDLAVFGSDNDTLSGEVTVTALSLYAPLIDSDKSKQYRTPKYRYTRNKYKSPLLNSLDDENY